ncbi:Na+/H+ antiporter NhaC family protein [Paenibacillus hexagrammi]|uniref:Sodium:proton antiporter n=1 Tax=Paenibacillus hexagrammi TaxID=2908839 RepID=A0ABY3SPL4_9BACL|nr:Na+/H+ antiporter NhaC family protein [Paenibacillus sp. YPD9-1]UJF35184.1 sodium:proton antiporter [Paenibacillus sp. YPD9-1]
MRMLSTRQFIFIVMTTITGLAAAYLLNIPLAFGFALGLIALLGFSWKAGLSAKTLTGSMLAGMKHTREVVWILALVGLLIPAWTASGTIPYMIDSGIHFIDPRYFVTFAFVLSAVISMLLGTSTGTLSSVGIPLMGLGGYLHIPLSMLAGALVSGAFVGDRTSPFSSARQLTGASTGVKGKEQWKAMLPTTVAGILVAVVCFAWEDWEGSWHHAGIAGFQQQFGEGFIYSPWLLVPAAILLLSIALRLGTRNGFMLSILSAVTIGSLFQHITWTTWFQYLWNGYSSDRFHSLETKGFSSMIELMVLILMAGAFNGILEENKVLQLFMEKLLGTKPTLLGATMRTSIFGLLLCLISCNQTLPIMMTGRSLLPRWEQTFPRHQLTRIVADTSLIFAAMVPWNLLGVLCGTILGVPVESYIMHAPFLWSLPVCTWIWSYVCVRGETGSTYGIDR